MKLNRSRITKIVNLLMECRDRRKKQEFSANIKDVCWNGQGLISTDTNRLVQVEILYMCGVNFPTEDKSMIREIIEKKGDVQLPEDSKDCFYPDIKNIVNAQDNGRDEYKYFGKINVGDLKKKLGAKRNDKLVTIDKQKIVVGNLKQDRSKNQAWESDVTDTNMMITLKVNHLKDALSIYKDNEVVEVEVRDRNGKLDMIRIRSSFDGLVVTQVLMVLHNPLFAPPSTHRVHMTQHTENTLRYLVIGDIVATDPVKSKTLKITSGGLIFVAEDEPENEVWGSVGVAGNLSHGIKRKQKDDGVVDFQPFLEEVAKACNNAVVNWHHRDKYVAS